MASNLMFTVAILTIFIQGSWSKAVNTVSIGGMTISSDGDTLRCDSLTCPETGEKCVITMKTDDEDKTKIVTWKRCLDKNRNVVLEDKFTIENKNPNNHFNTHMEGSRGGNIFVGSYDKSISEDSFDGEKLANEISEEIKDGFRGFWDDW